MGFSPRGNYNPAVRKPPPKRVRLLYERRISLFSFLVALPGLSVSGILLWLAPWARAAVAIVCLTAGVAVVNVTPENPYQMPPPHILSVQPTHLNNFGNIVRTLAKCWPFAALVLLLALARTRAIVRSGAQ